jgi:hypothetical protein
LLSALILLGFLVHSGNGFAQKQSFRYTARLAVPVLQPGEFKAPKLVWSCKGNICETRSPAALSPIGQCHELAKLVGRVSAFGIEGKSLDAIGLEECAKGIQIVNRPPQQNPGFQLPNLSDLGNLSNLTRNTGEGSGDGKGAGANDGKTPDDDASSDELPPPDPYPDVVPGARLGDDGVIRTLALILEGSAAPSGYSPEAFEPVVIRTDTMILEARSSVIRTPAFILESTGP